MNLKLTAYPYTSRWRSVEAALVGRGIAVEVVGAGVTLRARLSPQQLAEVCADPEFRRGTHWFEALWTERVR